MWRRLSPDDQRAQQRAAELLATDGAQLGLGAEDALKVVAYMQPHRVAAGSVLTRAGESGPNHAMALILAGEVTVENAAADSGMVVSVLGPGGLIGEMSLLDERARSATCTAASDLAVALLTREALERLIDAQPAVGARLLLGIARRIADHLRETNRKLAAMAHVGKAMQQELDAVHAVNRRLLDQVAALEQRAR